MTARKVPPARAVWRSPSGCLATWFGCGLFPKAPGTIGSLGALPAAYALRQWGGYEALLYATLFLGVIGVWICNRYMKQFSRHDDPKEVVIDEVVGMWIALLPAWFETPSWWIAWILAFLLFRFFDVFKPWPICWADEKVKGGLGVMLDDVFAGVCAALSIWTIQYVTMTH